MTSTTDPINRAFNALSDFENSGRAEALRQAIHYASEAMQQFQQGSPRFTQALRLRCFALNKLCSLSPQSEAIENLLHCLRQLLETEQDPDARLGVALPLAHNLEYLWVHHDPALTESADEKWDQSIQLLDETLACIPVTHNNWSDCAIKTGSLHLMRYQALHRHDHLERALALLEHAEKAHDAPGLELYRNLSAGYLDRYLARHAATDIYKAVETGYRAAELAADLPPLEQGLLTLGLALQQLSLLEPGDVQLEESIRCFETILQGSPMSAQQHLSVSGSLLQSLVSKGEKNSDADCIRRGIELAVDARKQADPDDPNQHWICNMLQRADLALNRLEPAHDRQDVMCEPESTQRDQPRYARDTLLSASSLAEDHAQNNRYDKVLELVQIQIAPLAAEFPWEALHTGLRLGRTAMLAREWETAAALLSMAMNCRQHLILAQPSPADLLNLLEDSCSISDMLCLALVHAGRLDDALVAIEEARSFMSSRLLLALSPDVYRLRKGGHMDIFHRLREASQAWYAQLIDAVVHSSRLARRDVFVTSIGSLFNGQDTPTAEDAGTDYEEWVHAQDELRQSIASIRNLPGFENFGRSLAVDDILAAAGEDTMVYLAATEMGGLALGVDGRERNIHVTWLPEFTDNEIYLSQGAFIGAMTRWRKFGDIALFRDAIIAESNRFWESALKHVVANVSHRDRFFLVGCDNFHLFPLQALGRAAADDRPAESLIDHLAVHYVANAASLQSRRVILNETGTGSLLAVSGASAQELPSAPAEIAAVTSHFTQACSLNGEDARKTNVLQQLPRHDVWHLACHGTANIVNPFAARLELPDSPLLLADLLELPPAPHRLAFLSACETGLGSIRRYVNTMDAGEILLLCGAAGSVSTLWMIDDFATMIMVARFYDLWRNQALQPGEALRRTQLWMRDTSNSQKAAELEQSGGVERDFLEQLRLIEYDLSDPLYWSAFRITGV